MLVGGGGGGGEGEANLTGHRRDDRSSSESLGDVSQHLSMGLRAP